MDSIEQEPLFTFTRRDVRIRVREAIKVDSAIEDAYLNGTIPRATIYRIGDGQGVSKGGIDATSNLLNPHVTFLASSCQFLV